MAGKSRCRNTLLYIVYIGLTTVFLAGCSTVDRDAGTAKNEIADESTASAGENEMEDGAAAEQVQGADMSANAGLDTELLGKDSVLGGDGVLESDSVTERISLSIFGDSISTYDGYIPEGFSVFYPYNGEVTDVSQTWWMQLLDDTGMELCANDSSSGSTCVGDSLSIDDPKYGCSDYRISSLTGEQGKTPDAIIIFIGTNDLMTDVPLGDNDGTKFVEEGMIENFSDAYCLILDKIQRDYPAARIYCCTLAQIGTWGTDQPFVTLINQFGLTSEDYSERIETIAKNKGIPVIDLYHCGIEPDNLHIMTSDGVHLKPDGMKCVERAILDGISNME